MLSPLQIRISIHAPREGSDGQAQRGQPGSKKISIHAPREGSDVLKVVSRIVTDHFYPRSPRGERPARWDHSPTRCHFYPRSPRGERPAQAGMTVSAYVISIHAPREGSDEFAQPGRQGGGISIHAPREGSDSPGRPAHGPPGDFYPRSPRGERPAQVVDKPDDDGNFYPRSPRGERRACSNSSRPTS